MYRTETLGIIILNISNCSDKLVRSFAGNMNIGNNIFQCHRNVTIPLLLHTLCMSSVISQCSMSGLLLPAPCTGEQQLLPVAGYSGEGGGTVFPRPSTLQTDSTQPQLRHMSKFSF